MTNLLVIILALTLLSSYHAWAATDSSCSAAHANGTAHCGSENSSELQALVQRSKLRLQQAKAHHALSKVSGHGDVRDVKKPETVFSYVPKGFSVLQSASLLQQLHVVMSKDESVAFVRFVSAGMVHQYQMVAASSYTADANISIWTGTAWEYMHPGRPRTFRSREEGRYASARIHEDGSLSGLFEQKDGRTIDVRPLDAHDPADPAYSLLAEHQGQGIAHVFSVTSSLDLALNPFGSRALENLVQVQEAAVTTTPELSSGEDEVKHMGKPCSGCSPTGGLQAQSEWGGDKFYPGCYSGDSKMHTLVIGFAIPPNVFSGGSLNEWPTIQKAKKKWEDIVTKASYIYEKQLNVQLALGDVKVAQEGGPKWAMVGCTEDFINEMLGNMKASVKSNELAPPLAVWHGFPNCGNTVGVAGQAYTEVLCSNAGCNVGVTKWQYDTAWFTFAHELGHNFGARHSFEEGQGETGGVMDYGDGKINGYYQFNRKYRKSEICKHLNDISGSCPHFREGALPPSPSPWPDQDKPPVPPTNYSLAPVHSECPAHHTRINDSWVCYAAARSLGIKYLGEETNKFWPNGCYKYVRDDDAYKGIHFNKHIGKLNHFGKLVCKEDPWTGAPRTTTTTTLPDHEYIKGPRDTNECPENSVAISNENVCKAAAASLNLPFKPWYETDNMPRGCYSFNTEGQFKGVYFNTHATGTRKIECSPICIATSKPAPTPTPAPAPAPAPATTAAPPAPTPAPSPPATPAPTPPPAAPTPGCEPGYPGAPGALGPYGPPGPAGPPGPPR